MREQPHYTDLLTKEFFEKHYIREGMSYPKIRKMLLDKGHNIHIGTLHSYSKKFGISRNHSEARLNITTGSLDYKKHYITEDTVEAIDGFLLGDGCIRTVGSQVARLSCGLEHKEFAEYLMSHFSILNSQVKGYKDLNMSSGIQWQGSTRSHPDIKIHYKRWYPSTKKQPPNDVRITPKSVMMWYLGDGSLVQGKNTVVVRLSTDGFDEERVEFLVKKMRRIGILCHRNNDNRIFIEAKGVSSFFHFIGKKSPVSCYDYKFDLPEWRLNSKRMKEVANDLKISYNRLSYLVKNGTAPCFRASEKGKPRFLPEHIEVIKKLIDEKTLY